jgi:hypothetical protein
MYLPAGHYTLKKLIKVLNSFVNEYDVSFVIQEGGRIGVRFDPILNYVYNYSENNDGMTYSDQMNMTQFRADLEIDLTESLNYMLGLTEWVIHPKIKKAMVNLAGLGLPLMICIIFLGKLPEHYTFYGKYMPDMSNGITELFIYCDEVEQSIVGDTKGRLLAIIPLNIENQGSSSLCTYRPPEVNRGLIKCKITHLHIGVYDKTYTLIPFSTGTVTIECVIE